MKISSRMICWEVDHWLDAGDITGKALVSGPKEFAVSIIGPTRANHKWQASLSPGFDASQFFIDWEAMPAVWTARAQEQ
jgi:hypothetical protein